jgi:phosphoribosylformylglycinamidine synthase subunit PurL
VPTRQQHMKAGELLLIESQERMLIVMEKGKEAEVLRIFEKWDLPCSQIGEVTGNGRLTFYKEGVLEADLPAESLVLGGGAPIYDREYRTPVYLSKVNAFDAGAVPKPVSLKGVADKLVRLPGIASKRWIYTQYDSMVGTANASTNAPSDAAIVLVKGTEKALAVTTDCNSRYVYADPYTGGMIAVAEAARNIVCSGGLPLAITNCLNFGNPYDPEVYYQFVHAIQGMGAACLAFDTPVTGGNVSFYNQSPDGPVYPTPTIGMVGLLEHFSHRMTLDFKQAGDLIYLLGQGRDDLGSSEYLHKVMGVEYSPAPHFDLEEEKGLQAFILNLIRSGKVRSAHDVSEGGLVITLLEKGFNRGLGFRVQTGDTGLRGEGYWFGEAQSRVVITVTRSGALALETAAAAAGVPFEKLGEVTGGAVSVQGEDWGNISSWKDTYDTAIESYLQN